MYSQSTSWFYETPTMFLTVKSDLVGERENNIYVKGKISISIWEMNISIWEMNISLTHSAVSVVLLSLGRCSDGGLLVPKIAPAQ